MQDPLPTYCLLQDALEDIPEIGDLQAAAEATTALTRHDALNLHRDLHGIVVAGLELDDARIFKTVLASRGHATRLCAEEELPVLPESYQVQRLNRDGNTLILTNSMGRVSERLVADLVFMGAAFHHKTEIHTGFDQRVETDSRGAQRIVNTKIYAEDEELWFRLDLFFHTEPHRINLALTRDSAIFHQDQVRRMRDRNGLTEMLRDMATWLPPERLSSQLRDPGHPRIYRTLHLYENEIRWHFARLTATPSLA